jgi:hypothetical protein
MEGGEDAGGDGENESRGEMEFGVEAAEMNE